MKKLIFVVMLLCMMFDINIIQVFAEQNIIIWHDMKLTPSKYNEMDFVKSGDVIFHTEYNTYNKDVKEIKYIFENHTGMKATYGYDTELEVFANGKWYEIFLTRCIDDVGIL